MVDENDLGLFPRLELEAQHRDLDRERGEEHEVVAAEHGVARIPEIGADDQRHHRAAEQAGPGLLDPEAHELVGERGPPAAAGPVANALLDGDEPGERRPDGGRAGLRSVGRALEQAEGRGLRARAMCRDLADAWQKRHCLGNDPRHDT